MGDSDTPRDQVDRVLEQWHAEEPGLDASPMGVVGRLQRAARLLDRGVAERFAAFAATSPEQSGVHESTHSYRA